MAKTDTKKTAPAATNKIASAQRAPEPVVPVPTTIKPIGNVLWVLDNGHGQETAGKRSPVWKDGSQLMEWKFNREMVELIRRKAVDRGMNVYVLVQETRDVSLADRVKEMNAIKTDLRKCLISNHANAAADASAQGLEIFTTEGQNNSDILAQCLLESLFGAFPEVKKRVDETDGDLDKEAPFYIIKGAKFPAVLVEYGFMTNEFECRSRLMNAVWKERAAEAVVRGMMAYESKH